ncbi:MAG TPA: transglycosylase SLT domain-containing protein, partial [Candidatus Sulfotelmatobacter sp.]
MSTAPAATVPPLNAAPPPTTQPVAGNHPLTDPPRQEIKEDDGGQQLQASGLASSTASDVIPSSDPVAQLISQAEKEFQAGLANIQLGKTEAAQKNFDSALNALLESNLDVRSDERLEKEFDRIVNEVNKNNPEGTPTDAEAQQKSEPAPIDETNGLTPAADPNIKAKAQAQLKAIHSDLPLMMTDQVAGYISYFSNRGRGVFERALTRSGRYHDMMVSILKEEGVPQDLIYLAQAESGFHPLAVSRAGARGIWQFMGSRARGY